MMDHPALEHVRVRKARVGDEEQLVALTRQIAQAEGCPESCTVTAENLREVVLEDGWAEGLVAVEPDDDTQILGAILYYRSYPSYAGVRGFFLENVAVVPEARGRGVATALFVALAQEAEALGVTKYEWGCHRDNVVAQQFYENRVRAWREDQYMLYSLSPVDLAEG